MAALVVLCLLMTHACRALNSGHVGVYRHCHPVSGTHIQVRGHACVLTEEVASPHQCPVFYCEQVTFPSFYLHVKERSRAWLRGHVPGFSFWKVLAEHSYIASP